MTDEKIIQFTDLIIRRTKDKDTIWCNLYRDEDLARQYNNLLPGFSFFTNVINGLLILGKDIHDDIHFYVIPSNQTAFLFSELISENSYFVYQGKLRRLYDIVYSSLPSIESFVDDFLNA